jgi:hypothetical protein
MLNLSSATGLITAGHGCAETGGRRYRARTLAVFVDRTDDLPTIRSSPSRDDSRRLGDGAGHSPAHDIQDMAVLDLEASPSRTNPRRDLIFHGRSVGGGSYYDGSVIGPKSPGPVQNRQSRQLGITT